jgi:hypothetical protein
MEHYETGGDTEREKRGTGDSGVIHRSELLARAVARERAKRG